MMADYTLSSGNVFKDLGLPNPDERFAKAKLGIEDQSPNSREGNAPKGICPIFRDE